MSCRSRSIPCSTGGAFRRSREGLSSPGHPTKASTTTVAGARTPRRLCKPNWLRIPQERGFRTTDFFLRQQCFRPFSCTSPTRRPRPALRRIISMRTPRSRRFNSPSRPRSTRPSISSSRVRKVRRLLPLRSRMQEGLRAASRCPLRFPIPASASKRGARLTSTSSRTRESGTPRTTTSSPRATPLKAFSSLRRARPCSRESRSRERARNTSSFGERPVSPRRR